MKSPPPKKNKVFESIGGQCEYDSLFHCELNCTIFVKIEVDFGVAQTHLSIGCQSPYRYAWPTHIGTYLNWDSHVTAVTRRCCGLLVCLAHVRHHVPSGVLKTIVGALVLPHLQYCISVYGTGKKGI